MASLLLASASPRRRDLLTSAGIAFDIRSADIDESAIRGHDPRSTAALLARAKTETVLAMVPQNSWQWVLGVDTLIDLEGEIIEKASDRDEAARILMRLSGKRHRVVTAVCLHVQDRGCFIEEIDETTVRFKSLESQEIDWYLDSGEWQGAAGAYMIQGRAACFVEELHGSYSGVVGLPLPLIYGMLRSSGYRFGQFA